MNAKEIIENIDDVYARFQVPKHLQRHMRLVTGVTAWLCDRAQEPVDKELLIACALIHDMGNIVKFDFSLDSGGEFVEGVDKLKEIQKVFEEKYGTNDHKATLNMLKELGVNQELLILLDLADWKTIGESTKNGLLAPMILSYADYRIAPKGVVSIEERIADIHTRYKKKHNITFNEEKFAKAANNFRVLEIELFQHINGSPEDITAQSIN